MSGGSASRDARRGNARSLHGERRTQNADDHQSAEQRHAGCGQRPAQAAHDLRARLLRRRFAPRVDEHEQCGGCKQQRTDECQNRTRQRVVVQRQSTEIQRDRREVCDGGRSAIVPSEELEQQHEDGRPRQRRQSDEHAIVSVIFRYRRRPSEPEARGPQLIGDLTSPSPRWSLRSRDRRHDAPRRKYTTRTLRSRTPRT